VTLLGYMHCEISEREDLLVCEDGLVRRFHESLEVGGLHATLAGTLRCVLPYPLHARAHSSPH